MTSRETPFVKMHGLGNDYVYVDLFETSFDLAAAPDAARRLSPRRTGVGADGLIFVAPSERADGRMIMFNADGSRGRMCGNGLRCAARLLHEKLGFKKALTIETDAGLREARVLSSDPDGTVVVAADMGRPSFDPKTIPIRSNDEHVDRPLPLPSCGGMAPRATCLSMGNPHAVLFVDDPAVAPVTTLGAEIEALPYFPERTNVEFVRVVAPDRLSMRVFERGSGETAACGTGACAALVAAARTGRAGRSAVVAMQGGEARVDWEADDRVLLTGPTVVVFRGVFDLRRG
jgi:diaminopimelate epimerase